MKPCVFALAIFVAVTTSLGEKRESWILNAPRVAKWDQNIATTDDWTATGEGIGTTDWTSGSILHNITYEFNFLKSIFSLTSIYMVLYA